MRWLTNTCESGLRDRSWVMVGGAIESLPALIESWALIPTRIYKGEPKGTFAHTSAELAAMGLFGCYALDDDEPSPDFMTPLNAAAIHAAWSGTSPVHPHDIP